MSISTSMSIPLSHRGTAPSTEEVVSLSVIDACGPMGVGAESGTTVSASTSGMSGPVPVRVSVEERIGELEKISRIQASTAASSASLVLSLANNWDVMIGVGARPLEKGVGALSASERDDADAGGEGRVDCRGVTERLCPPAAGAPRI